MFEKNLNYITNEPLKKRLSRLSLEQSRVGITYVVTPSKDYVLLKDDMPVEDLNDPKEAVKKMLSENIKNEMKSNDFIVMFGIGLGYLLDEAFNKYPSQIYVYEPDLKLLHFVLCNIDISEHLASGRVYITDDLNELIAKLDSSYLTKDKVEVVYLQNYGIVRNKDLLLMTQKVLDTCRSKMVDINTITKFSQKWLTNTLNNLNIINNNTAYLLSDLEDKFAGQTALILGAGPSLAHNIEKIQANRNKFVIFAVNKAIKYLVLNGVIPDFAVCLDAGNMLKTLDVADEYIERMNCIIDIRTDKDIFKKPFRRFFVNFSESDFLIKKIAKFNSFMKFYESGGSASIMALVSAVKLGFAKAVLAGIDLAFDGNVIYADGQTMERVSQNDIMVDAVKKHLATVKSVNGGTVQTREDYVSFIHHFEVIIKELKYTEIYNLSKFGAAIEGVKPTEFEYLNLFTPANTVALATLTPFKVELQDFIQDEFFNINNIISLLSKGVFSPALVSSIVKSVLVYQYMQREILTILQRNFEPEIAEDFIAKTKSAIKVIVETLQQYKLI